MRYSTGNIFYNYKENKIYISTGFNKDYNFFGFQTEEDDNTVTLVGIYKTYKDLKDFVLIGQL